MMLMSDSRETLRFRDFELDIAAYELRRRGRPVRLERQPMDVLIMLVERRGLLVSRSDIVERLWGRTSSSTSRPAFIRRFERSDKRCTTHERPPICRNHFGERISIRRTSRGCSECAPRRTSHLPAVGAGAHPVKRRHQCSARGRIGRQRRFVIDGWRCQVGPYASRATEDGASGPFWDRLGCRCDNDSPHRLEMARRRGASRASDTRRPPI
jgi:hypothetical protein